MSQSVTDHSTTLLLMMVLLIIKHYLADFPLQTKYMNKKTNAKNWVGPLLAHSGLHASLTMLVFLPFIWLPGALFFAIGDLIVHTVVDYWRARHARHLNQFQKAFWNVLGLDQMLHHLTYVAAAFIAYKFYLLGQA